MKKSLRYRLALFGVAILMVVQCLPVSAVGEWADIFIVQSSVNHPSGCTVCTLQLILQNSMTLKPEWQFSAGQQTSWSGKYKEFDLYCADNGSGNGISRPIDVAANNKTSDSVQSANFPKIANSMVRSDITWQSVTTSSVGGQSVSNTSTNIVTGVGNKDFKTMHSEDSSRVPKSVIAAMKLFYNAGYFVVVGIKYKGATNSSNGPDGYKANHWAMLAGVDDNDVYFNDPANGKITKLSTATAYSKPYQIQYLLLFANNQTSPLSLAGGQKAELTESDYSNLTNLGVPDSATGGLAPGQTHPSLNVSLSNDALLSSCRLTEANLEELFESADVDNLAQDDLEVLEGWRSNIESEKREWGFIAILRWVTSLVGILLTLWALLVYLAFWFDHINSFFYLDFLHLLTFGALHICPPGEKPTFRAGKDVKNRTVSHAQILSICITAILFGALLISGVFYQLVAKLVHFVTGFVWGS